MVTETEFDLCIKINSSRIEALKRNAMHAVSNYLILPIRKPMNIQLSCSFQ